MPDDHLITQEREEPAELTTLLDLIREQRPTADTEKIRQAFHYAKVAHEGQTRQSGEPYITHPLAVARILVDLKMDDDTIIASLLHDTLEDCEAVTAEGIQSRFGSEVLHLVEGVTKLRFLRAGEMTERQKRVAETMRTAETLRKMLLAMAKDFRVMVIKLADRMHNLLTIDGLPLEKSTRIANETLDVYAPLAARLGIWQLKWQLEDLAFRTLHPREYRRVAQMVQHSRADRERDLQEIIRNIREKFEEAGVEIVDIHGRPKHIYSIHRKMVSQGLAFEDIHDLLAIRVLTANKNDCYTALGIVHSLYMPIMTHFYDYIAKPKANGYQSLHTKVMGPNGHTVEVQVRTVQMHEVAEFGVAAHWTYKEGKAALDETRRLQQLRRQLFDWSNENQPSSDFLRSVSTDLFSEQVFVFTPRGDVIDLPRGSSIVDFAFRVHTDLGMTLIGGKVNGIMEPLSTELQNGDVVQLITKKGAQPSMDWLKFVQSPHTRSKLRAFFRKRTKEADAHNGKEALEREFRSLGLDPKNYLGDEKLDRLVDQFDQCETRIDVLAKVGAGLLSVQSVTSKLRGKAEEAPPVDTIQVTKTREGKTALAVGDASVLVSRAKCCNPIPGDEVVGYVTRGRGVMIHRKVCPNAIAFQSSEPERLLPYCWEKGGSLYGVSLKITTLNRQGLLMDISTVFAEAKANISDANIRSLPNHTAEIEITIEVQDSEHLQHVMSKISNFNDVLGILRMFGRSAR